MQKHPIRKTGLSITNICFGTSGLGDMPDTYGYSVSEARARATLDAIFDGPVNFLDTSRNYGFGRSEARIGDTIRARGGLPDGFVLSTKLDREMDTGRFDADRAWASLDESKDALSLDHIPMLHLHDPEHARDVTEITKSGGALDALFRMKEEGHTSAVGLAMGRLDIMLPILKDWPFDVLISHNRWSLLNQSADAMFDYAQANGIAILNAAPFAGGVLSKGSAAMPRVTYQLADDDMLAPVREIEALCEQHDVQLGAAALQFSMRDARVASTIVGVSKPDRVQETLALSAAPLPEAFWDAIAKRPKDLSDPEASRIYHPG